MFTELDGEFLTRWTIRLAVACYLFRVFLDLNSNQPPQTARRARWIWTLGCVLYLTHVACAFHVYHHWSHAHAYAHTARQTAEVTGLSWGGGLYFNYLFTLFWIADAARWWQVAPAAHPPSRRYFWTLHLIFAFMTFNATVVFGPPFWRWAAGLIALLLALTMLYHRQRGK